MLLVKGTETIELSNPIQVDAYMKAGYIEDKKTTKTTKAAEKAADTTEKK